MTVPVASKWMQLLPNILTLCRIFVIPILVVLMSFPSKSTRAVAALLFIIASITDYFDGYLARRYNVTSSIGKLLDPMADKLIIMASLVMIIACKEGDVPAWMVVIILGREIMITSLRGVASTQGVVIEAEQLGKYKTILQIFAISGLLLHYPYCGVDFFLGGLYFLWGSLFLSIWSGVAYIYKFWFTVIDQE